MPSSGHHLAGAWSGQPHTLLITLLHTRRVSGRQASYVGVLNYIRVSMIPGTLPLPSSCRKSPGLRVHHGALYVMLLPWGAKLDVNGVCKWGRVLHFNIFRQY